ncbi:Oidioi.mRNA.OKI2018_I69.PAR.g13059.t1.cds [Oikopleura dioica]|uniref:Oidioi.mRNA.OKI2018_I69.PAR.g13059.t1.cds n=1 Tax=Oikopleura dioica TaxID=34765 RepID=A0ABN7S9U9_OIKDI|nr:Oidioi.mRNA.OKI2018_I69.PAR.g13059.t1.cds [Oikopleura dioica]
MLFSSFSMEKYAILVDGKPTAKFLKKQPKVFQHKSRYYPGHWDLYLIHLTHGLGDEYEDERVAFFAKDFESNPHLNEILPQLRFIIQQCSMCSVAERQLRMLQLLRGLLLNPFVDVARLEDELIKMAQFSLRDTGPEMIPGKEGLESAVQERATSFYNLMFKHGSICQEKLISSLRDIHPKDGSMFSLLSCGEAFLPAVRKGKSILARVAFLRRNIHCLTELIIRDDEPAASMMLVEPVGVFPTSLASQTLLFFRKIHCKDFGDRIRRDSNGQPKSKKKRRTKNVHDWLWG